MVPDDLTELICSIADAIHHVLQLWLAQSPVLLQGNRSIVEGMLCTASTLWSFPWTNESLPALREKWLTPGRVCCRGLGLWGYRVDVAPYRYCVGMSQMQVLTHGLMMNCCAAIGCNHIQQLRPGQVTCCSSYCICASCTLRENNRF
jgi:hypothetical protein